MHISAPDGGVLAAPVEGLEGETLERLRRLGREQPRLVLTSHRARAAGFCTESDSGVSLPLDGGLTVADILGLCCAAGPLPPAMPNHRLRATSRAEAAALALARAGRLIPAAVVTATGDTPPAELASLIADGTILDVPDEQAQALSTAPQLQVSHTSDAVVPLEGSEQSRFVLFREAGGVQEHVAILIGEQSDWPDPVTVRLHSACLTGDLFGSLRCDCGEQLRASVREIAGQGGGVLLYLAQEGRGIGLANKLRAYRLQDDGLDTVDADCTLGFSADERQYEAAVAMLHYLDVARVRLLTNNPGKVRALEAGGIQVTARQPLLGTLNHHNRRYLNTKADRAGHWLQALLDKA